MAAASYRRTTKRHPLTILSPGTLPVTRRIRRKVVPSDLDTRFSTNHLLLLTHVDVPFDTCPFSLALVLLRASPTLGGCYLAVDRFLIRRRCCGEAMPQRPCMDIHSMFSLCDAGLNSSIPHHNLTALNCLRATPPKAGRESFLE